MKKFTPSRNDISPSCMMLAVLIGVTSLAQPSFAQLRTWDAGGDGLTWTDPLNWSDDDAPDTVGESALIDGDTFIDSTVTLTQTSGAYETGAVTIDAGDLLTFKGGYSNSSGTLNATSLTNSGNFNTFNGGGSNNGAAIANVGVLTNNSGASILVQNSSGSNRKQAIISFDSSTSVNNGEITVTQTGNADRSGVQLRLNSSGTFINNGTINIDFNRATASSGTAQLTIADAVTLGGTGEVILKTTAEDRAQIHSRTVGETITNGINHTISGAGIIGAGDRNVTNSGDTLTSTTANVVNDGLIKATDASIRLRIFPNATATNSATGRIVGEAAGGIYIGSDTAARSFINNGLLEARSGSSVTFGSMNTDTLNGTIAGGGDFIGTLSLSGSATLEAGDLANADGTGTSTVGGMDITGDLALADTTILNFQLGDNSAAGISFDTIAVSGALTLDGILNVDDLAGFGAGSYRLFTFSSGNLTDNGLTLGSTPGAYTYSIDADNAGGFVDLNVIPEPSTFVLLVGSFGLLYFMRKRR
ncbi:PEP-CTERM sorting domain-containing protein [Kiritimatiellota bacterium B12222]|nr:PEP-CTERM sorting domain-containing protein [Kiritimatiellota bacterium B12222]